MKKPTEEELRLIRKTPWHYLTIEMQDWLKENDPEWLKVKDYYKSDKYRDSAQYNIDFLERYPKCGGFNFIEKPFDLVLDKEKALEILHDKRKAVVLPKNEETRKFLENKKAVDFYEWAKENDVKEAMYTCEHTYSRTNQYDSLHIHDKENTWFLDVKVWVTYCMTCVPEDVGSFRRRTKCHDLDAITRRLGRQGVDLNNRPYYP